MLFIYLYIIPLIVALLTIKMCVILERKNYGNTEIVPIYPAFIPIVNIVFLLGIFTIIVSYIVRDVLIVYFFSAIEYITDSDKQQILFNKINRMLNTLLVNTGLIKWYNKLEKWINT